MRGNSTWLVAIVGIMINGLFSLLIQQQKMIGENCLNDPPTCA